MIEIEQSTNTWAWILEYCVRHPDKLLKPADVPLTLTTEQTAILTARNVLITKRLAGKTSARNIPQWATWTEADANTWYQTNVRTPFAAATTLAALKTVVGTIITVQWSTIRLILAMRDHLWPDL